MEIYAVCGGRREKPDLAQRTAGLADLICYATLNSLVSFMRSYVRRKGSCGELHRRKLTYIGRLDSQEFVGRDMGRNRVEYSAQATRPHITGIVAWAKVPTECGIEDRNICTGAL